MNKTPIKKIFIYPYTTHSESAKLLANRLGALRIRLQNSVYEHSPENLVINWGNSNCPYPCLNSSSSLNNTIDKLRLFRLLMNAGHGDILPQYWTNSLDIPNSAFPVMCRTKTQGHDGDGIVVALNRNGLVDARLYTQYVGHEEEYRVTFFKGIGVTDIQTKRERAGATVDCPMIKTYSNGFGFQRLTVDPLLQKRLTELCEKVCKATGLDFFGLDVLSSNVLGTQLTLLEVNSAMGLEGQALEKFAQAVEKYVYDWNQACEAELPPAPPAPTPETPQQNSSILNAWAEACPSGYTKEQILTAVINLSL